MGPGINIVVTCIHYTSLQPFTRTAVDQKHCTGHASLHSFVLSHILIMAGNVDVGETKLCSYLSNVSLCGNIIDWQKW